MAGLNDFLRRLVLVVPAKKAAAGGASAAVIAAAMSFISPWEGQELTAYRDIVGVWTICNGATEGVRPGQTATPDECRDRLAQDVAKVETAIRPCLPATLPDPSRVAFVSAAYNVGPGAFCGSSMSRRARAGDLAGACDALLMWNKAGGEVVNGLTRRREAERALCRKGLE